MAETTKSRKRFALTLIAASLSLAGCGSRCTIESAIAAEEVSGDRVDCGSVPLDEDASQTNGCVVDAVETGKAFVARYQIQGIDSRLITAFVGDENGQVVRLEYDGSPGGLNSWEYVSRSKCDRPQLADTNLSADSLPLECDSWVGEQMACQTKGLALWFGSSDQDW